MSIVGLGPAALEPSRLATAPIRAEWVLHGEPRARAVEMVRSPDGTCTIAHWDCTAGSFRWFFWLEETVQILEGEVLVEDDQGVRQLLRTGDVAVMPANRWMVWRIDSYVRKMAICRYPVPRPFGCMVRGLQALRTWVGLKQLSRLPAPLPATTA